MNEKEFNEKLFQKDFWFSPSWVIDTFNYYVDAEEQRTKNRFEAIQSVRRKRNSKKLKEMWAVAVFLLGYEKMTANPHWLQPCIDTAPDALGVCLIPHRKVEKSHTQAQIFIEVTEWDNHTTQDLFERIKDKLSNKSYPEFYHLVVHITRQGIVQTDMDAISEQLIKISPRLAGIWIVVGSSKPKIQDNYLVACLFPIKAKYEFSYSKAVTDDRKNKIPSVMKIERGKGDNFYDLKMIRYSLPSL